MWDFFRVQFLTIALAVYSLFYTGYPYYLLCAAGLLMLVFTIENITEEDSILIALTKTVLILFICLLLDGFLVFILFGQEQAEKLMVPLRLRMVHRGGISWVEPWVLIRRLTIQIISFPSISMERNIQ